MQSKASIRFSFGRFTTDGDIEARPASYWKLWIHSLLSPSRCQYEGRATSLHLFLLGLKRGNLRVIQEFQVFPFWMGMMSGSMHYSGGNRIFRNDGRRLRFRDSGFH